MLAYVGNWAEVKMSMGPLAVLRIHRFTACPALVVQRIAEVADGILLVRHETMPEVYAAVKDHPKVVGVVDYEAKRWSNAGHLVFCAQQADRFEPEAVLQFDEDEIPPPQFKVHYDHWRTLGRAWPTMTFRAFWPWDSLDQIVAEHVYRYGWHCKVYRWEPNVWDAGFCCYNFPRKLYRERKYRCPFPLLHCAVLTQAMREARSRRDPRHWWKDWEWWLGERRLMPYDPDLTWDEWERMVGPLVEAPQSVVQPAS